MNFQNLFKDKIRKITDFMAWMTDYTNGRNLVEIKYAESKKCRKCY
jgi:hypothetical protein